jgi:hypothetical protein
MKSYRPDNKNTLGYLEQNPLPLPIIPPPRRQRYVRWDRVAIIAAVIAWWVALGWAYLQWKGGQS